MMSSAQRNQFKLDLPLKRPFSWPVFVLLVGLYLIGNLAGVPLLLKTGAAIEPIWIWAVVTGISAIVIAISLLLANQIGLGAPFFEGRLTKEDRKSWLQIGFRHTLIILLLWSPLSLIANRGITSATYPFGWELVLASFKAGVVEEIVSRFFLVSLLAWLGGFIKRDRDGRPAPAVLWVAILVAGLLFGWAHVDSISSNPAAQAFDKALVMVLSSGLGVYFGWLYWKLGLEWAIFAHFSFDVYVSTMLIPVYLFLISIF